MKTWWTLNTNGDPLTSVREFLHGLWVQGNLDGMLIPAYRANDLIWPAMLDDPVELENADPFAPLQIINAAQVVAQEARKRPQARLAAVLRPCEVRALFEKARHDSFRLDNWLIIGVDCLATFSAEDYAWRVKKWHGPDYLTQKALQFARQGGIAAYRFRSACQMCTLQGSQAAHINICLLGLPVHSSILISTADENTADRFGLSRLTDGQASPLLINQRARILTRTEERHQRARFRAGTALADDLPENAGQLAALLNHCAQEEPPCQCCLEVCPLCAEMDLVSNGGLTQDKVEQWLASCVQCGVCEDACPKHTPLIAIIHRIRQATLQNPAA